MNYFIPLKLLSPLSSKQFKFSLKKIFFKNHLQLKNTATIPMTFPRIITKLPDPLYTFVFLIKLFPNGIIRSTTNQ